VYVLSETCPICSSLIEDEGWLCEIHRKAFENLKSAYGTWYKAYRGKITIEDFCRRIVELKDTGQAAKEVADYVSRNTSLVEGKWGKH